ncbi:MAG: hypothetical protein EOM73_12555 [Bacteroidia bacterium]|nr:hypothetical protein [Bacteroidia bacterium]
MKRKKSFFPLIIAFSLFLLTGCIRIIRSDLSDGPQNPDPSEAAAQGSGGELTSLEAAALAYSEAVKWREDAVFWYALPVAAYLNEDWENTDTSWKWAILFVCGDEKIRYNVTIEGNAVKNAVPEDIARTCDIKTEFPADRPGISMKEAAKTALANHMPSHIMPMILYTIENSNDKYNGRPVWEFLFGLDDQYYIYIIDGLNGDLIEITGEDGNPVAPPAEQVQTEPVLNASQSGETFISILDSGKINEALDMLTADKTENETNKNMWSDSFSSVDSITVISAEEVFKDEWNSIRAYYKYTLDVKLKPGAQPGLWEDGEIVRWITVVLENGQWKISEISMNP